MAGWASGLAGWPRGGDERTDGRTDGKSPHSTGLRPLPGPLPKKGKTTIVDEEESEEEEKEEEEEE